MQTKYPLIAESLVFQATPAYLRLNKYHPPYLLQLFNCDTNEENVIHDDWFVIIIIFIIFSVFIFIIYNFISFLDIYCILLFIDISVTSIA